MDLSKFTEKSQAALTEAQAIALRHQHQAVDVEHLIPALSRKIPSGTVPDGSRVTVDFKRGEIAFEAEPPHFAKAA